ncbi:Protein transporter SEC9 [Mycena kentingensis (nom. inval.)]|nr:Protein transporter SEC9 [Mycena kentingensis (nom. inval.)]
MPLFKRNNNESHIPPVEGEGTSPQPDLRNQYSRNNGVGDTYTRAGDRGSYQLAADRNELMGGYKPSGSGRFFDGESVDTAQDDEEEDVEAIKQKTRFMKKESVASTQNSLRLAREAVETGNGTLRRLEEQSERLENTDHHLDVTKNHLKRAEDKTEELRKLNRSIFIPAITVDQSAKHHAREFKTQRSYEEKRAQREQGRIDARVRLNAESNAVPSSSRSSSRSDRKRFQFEATASDDELEDELDGNLDEIYSLAKTMKALGTNMNSELERQNGVIAGIEDKAGKVDGRMHISTVRLDRAGR